MFLWAVKGQHGGGVPEEGFLFCSEVQEEGPVGPDQRGFPYKTRDSNAERQATKQEDDFIGIIL